MASTQSLGTVTLRMSPYPGRQSWPANLWTNCGETHQPKTGHAGDRRRRNSTKGSGAARGISIPHKPGAWWAFSCHFDAAAD